MTLEELIEKLQALPPSAKTAIVKLEIHDQYNRRDPITRHIDRVDYGGGVVVVFG